jgi:hypothetical protein
VPAPARRSATVFALGALAALALGGTVLGVLRIPGAREAPGSTAPATAPASTGTAGISPTVADTSFPAAPAPASAFPSATPLAGTASPAGSTAAPAASPPIARPSGKPEVPVKASGKGKAREAEKDRIF